MPIYEWSDEYTVDVPSIDEQHKRIFDLVAAMHAARVRGNTDDVAIMIILDMQEYIHYHFDHEEEYMRNIDYPDVDDHIQLHREMSARVRCMQDELQDGLVRVEDVARVLADWLRDHILGADQEFAMYAREKDAA